MWGTVEMRRAGGDAGAGAPNTKGETHRKVDAGVAAELGYGCEGNNAKHELHHWAELAEFEAAGSGPAAAAAAGGGWIL